VYWVQTVARFVTAPIAGTRQRKRIDDMTELEQARAHLLACQRDLHSLRLADFPTRIISTHEAYVLAALSWVWEAQQRDADRNAKEEAAEFFSAIGPRRILIGKPLPGFYRCLPYSEYQKQLRTIAKEAT
jgi:hypothetical protein